MDAVGRNVPFVVDNGSVVVLHLSIRLESISPDLSQPLGEVFSLLQYRFEVSLVADSKVTANHPKHVAARRDERYLVSVTALPS